MQKESDLAKPLMAGLCGILAVQFILWLGTNRAVSPWPNVPSPPSGDLYLLAGGGDSGFLYRIGGYMLQNMGDMRGEYTNINTYDFRNLVDWFYLMGDMDPVSNYVPTLAAFVYGSAQDKEDIRRVVAYLRQAGNIENAPGAKEKWRWLAHAVFLARHKLEDDALALDIAEDLAAKYRPGTGMPNWVRRMRPLILSEMGEKQMALMLLTDMLTSGAGQMRPQEVYVVKEQICIRVLEREEARALDMCAEFLKNL